MKGRRVERKLSSKRQLQLDAMQKKADAQDAYFRQCQREAADERRKRAKPSLMQTKSRESDLFGEQRAQGINFAKYDEIKVEVKRGSRDDTVEKGFNDYDELDLHPTIRRNIELMNYKRPTPIQRYAIPLALGGEDLMCCAQTGSGKTCAFLLPVCVSLDKQNSDSDSEPPSSNSRHCVSPRCIVLAPTRELASQIQLEAEKLIHNMTDITSVVVYGGASQNDQIRQLAFGADIIVATPGRLTDFVDRSLIALHEVRFLVLDEADRMLDMGFEPQIRRLVLQSGMTLKTNRQTFMFSATFPDKIQLLAREFLRDYTWIAVGRVGSTTDSITQVLVQATADKRHKLKLVVQAVQKGPEGRTLIFVQKKKTATWLKKQLNRGGPNDGSADEQFAPIKAVDIHGDRSQSQREAALTSFRSGECRVLVATDVAARGLDIDGVEHVINMDLPLANDDFDSYVHRIGRTGRAGHTGLATSLYVPGDAPKVGNGKIAQSMIVQLREAGQEVPSWLEAEVAGSGGSDKSKQQKQQFGGTDVRNGGGRSDRNGHGRGNTGPSPGGRGRGRSGRGGGRSIARQSRA
jgi:ATP-dependent RNA helicase DDX3X